MQFTDSHCHLDFDELSCDLTALLAECFSRGIHQLIIPSISPDNWEKVLTLVQSHQIPLNNQTKTQTKNEQCTLHACLGIHPWFLKDLNSNHLEQLSTKVQSHKEQIVAIGETGIDGGIVKQQDNLLQQQNFFSFQVNLAKQHDLPLIIHHRQSHQEIINILKMAKTSKGGIVHAFSGSYQQAKAYVDLGFSLGIGGTITYPRAKKTTNAIKRLPLTSLVLETDAPSMPLFGHQGESNSPLQLLKVFDCLTQIRNESTEVIAKQLEENVKNVFGLKSVTNLA